MTTPTAATVQLESFPMRLFLAAEEQWEAMLREYALRGLGGTTQSYGGDELTRAGNALATVAAAVGTSTAGAESHRALLVEVPAPSDFGVLQAILEDAWQLAMAGDLLCLPSLPEIVALRNWMCEQVTSQAAGATAAPWSMTGIDSDDYGITLAEWDDGIAPDDGEAWLVGDDHNRIVGASTAALSLLGWDEAALIGQRLLTVIPPRLREAHVAGFTRSVVSGAPGLLGQRLAVPALSRTGEEIPITLTLSRHPAGNGRSVYLARMDPPEET